MIDRYTNYYQQRSASREKSMGSPNPRKGDKHVEENSSENKENKSLKNNQVNQFNNQIIK